MQTSTKFLAVVQKMVFPPEQNMPQAFFSTSAATNLKFVPDADNDYVSYEVDDNQNILISFLAKKRAKTEPYSNKEGYYTSAKRQTIKPGKFFRKLFPEQNEDLVRKFTEAFIIQAISHLPTVQIYDASHIKRLYYEVNYVRPDVSGGRLLGSCMRHERAQSYFDMLIQNPERVSILGAEKEGKVAGRALIWKARQVETGEEFSVLDRIYAATKTEEEFMLEFAKSHLDFIRTEERLFYRANEKANTAKNIHFEVPIKHWRGKLYPYMDTFSWIDKVKHTLTNRQPAAHYRFCQSQEGKHTDSEGDMLETMPEGHVYVYGKGVGAPLEDVVEIGSYFYLKTDVTDCDLCKENIVIGSTGYKLNLYDGTTEVRVCRKHRNGDYGYYHHKGVRYEQCRKCDKWDKSEGSFSSRKKFYCTGCSKDMTECADCQTKVMDPISLKDKSKVCRPCAKKCYSCNHCQTYVRPQDIHTIGVYQLCSEECAKRYSFRCAYGGEILTDLVKNPPNQHGECEFHGKVRADAIKREAEEARATLRSLAYSSSDDDVDYEEPVTTNKIAIDYVTYYDSTTATNTTWSSATSTTEADYRIKIDFE